MKTKLPLFIIWLSVSASCASVLPVPEGSRTEMPTQENASDGIPYPVPTLQDRLDYLEGKIVRLSNEVEMLNGKVKALEHAKTHPSGRTYVQKLDDRKLKEHYLNTEGGSASAHTVETAQNLYNQALKHYQNGRFSAAAALLKGADGGDGGSIAQRSMYLLLQSRARMGNCESVIEIGGRYANRFKDSPTAPEVIFKIGKCQYRLQQKDIARATWRSLIQTYPGSPAAKRAAAAVRKR
ncbi:tetratricopeptide repeat protein [Neisseria gonorrhoeae]|uniref:tetratricopeptide repeat protein n=1 Tax=Neisseria gonorrhoeae TaxID=485 RepID=UPI003F6CA40B